MGTTCVRSSAVSAGLFVTAAGAATPVALAGAGGVECRAVPATVAGTDHRDAIIGTPGRDVIAAGKGRDHVDGRGGNDVICGGRGADHLRGGPGNDRIYGGADGLLFDEDQYGDDLVGGPGNDVLDGGPGLYGNDRGLDVLSYPAAIKRLRIDLAKRSARVGAQRDTVYSIEDVRGTPFDDVMRGDRHFQFLSGFDGDDRLFGRDGTDFLFGDNGDDVVHGGAGNDILDGGADSDVAYGGPNGRDGDQCTYFEERHGCES